jgi:tetratricopeptide (TPR) repeat protein
MERKAKLIELLGQAWAEEQAFIAGLTPAERAAQGAADHWSVKDVVAHVATWNERMAQTLEEIARGETPARIEDIDRANAEIFAQHCGKSWAEVMQFAEAAQRHLLAQVQLLDEDALGDAERFPWAAGRPLWRQIVGHAYMHPVAHLASCMVERGEGLRALQFTEQSAQLLEPLDASPGWRGLNRYNVACGYAQAGLKEPALDALRQALQLNPDLLPWSKEDPDLIPLRGEPAYQALYSE